MKKPILILSVLLLSFGASAQNLPSSASLDSSAIPENLGLGLRQLATLDQQTQAKDTIQSSKSIMSDADGRVLVTIYLDGKVAPTTLTAQLSNLDLEIEAVETRWRAGVISASLPISQAAAVAQLPGVRSVTLAHRPIRRVGRVTAESSVVEHAREVNTPGTVTAQGILGRGISVGIISDSYDQASGVSRASAGVASGDLPGPANPDGYSQPVVVLSDDSSSGVADEGRGMAEIVHDIAPAAKISFSTAGNSQVAMANAIRNLRTNSASLCDIIVDDIGFGDEPFFSDGIISRAVEDVVTSNTLAGKKVAYFSAAGNSPGAYAANANIISATTAQTYRGNINLSQVPSGFYAGGFQNVGTPSAPAIAIPVTTGSEDGHELSFQWDDPFDAGAVTTDYNLLVFSSTGQYLSSISGTDNNIATDEPVEIVELGKSTSYQLVICLRTASPPVATHLRLVSSDGNTLTSTYLNNNNISIFGHAAAADANCIAAYVYNNIPNAVGNYNLTQLNPPPGPYEPALETFNSTGGSLPYYFNSQGQRLSTPELRLKPDFSAADGVDTTFFPTGTGQDYDNDGYPNFFGTSAAAPNAAAFAALLLEAAGGPSTLTSAQIHSHLQQSTLAHDLDPAFAQATASNGATSIQLTASGDDSNSSSSSPNFFTATFSGQPGQTLSQLTIDLTNTSLVFDSNATNGFPFTVGNNPGNIVVSSSVSADQRVLTLSFGGNFTPGQSISFGIDRDLAGISAGGNSADFLAGASVVATTNTGQTLYGAFANILGSGFSPSEGYGLIDAESAVQQIVGTSPSSSGYPANLSTRGIVGSGDNVLIGGTIIKGTAVKKVLIRALGPSLAVPAPLADPTLELYTADGQKFAGNDNWQDDPAQAALIRASTLPPNDPRESALVENLGPSTYTAIVRGANGSTGVGLVEIYELDSQPPASRLANISTRGQVESGDNVLIAGFILRNASSQVVVRAAGPSLSGVSGVLADPSLELHDSQGNIVMSNDNWQQDTYQATQIQALGLAPASPLESAVTATLGAGAYTVIVRGAHNTTGVATVEVYEVR